MVKWYPVEKRALFYKKTVNFVWFCFYDVMFFMIIGYGEPVDAITLSHFRNSSEYFLEDKVQSISGCSVQTRFCSSKSKEQKQVTDVDPYQGVQYRLGNFQLSFSKSEPTLTALKKRFRFSIGTLIQYDVGGFIGADRKQGQPSMSGNQALLRRGRLIFTARYDDFKLIVAPDFGRAALVNDSIHEADLNYMGFKNTLISIGLLQPPATMVGSERSADFILLERPMIVDLVRNIAGANAREALSVIHWNKRYYISATVSGQRLGQTYRNFQEKQISGILRGAVHPIMRDLYDLHLGVNGVVAAHGKNMIYSMSALPEAQIWIGRPYIRTGKVEGVNNVWAVGPEFAFRFNRVLLQSEYYSIHFQRVSDQSVNRPNLHFSGWYVSANYVLFGQPRRYFEKGAFFIAPQGALINPAAGDWGALEWSARWSVMDFNSHQNRYSATGHAEGVQGGKQTVFATGFNWYPSMHMRLSLNYNRVMATHARNSYYNRTGRRSDILISRIQFNF